MKIPTSGKFPTGEEPLQ